MNPLPLASQRTHACCRCVQVKQKYLDKGQSKRIWGELYKVIDSSDVVIQVRRRLSHLHHPDFLHFLPTHRPARTPSEQDHSMPVASTLQFWSLAWLNLAKSLDLANPTQC